MPLQRTEQNLLSIALFLNIVYNEIVFSKQKTKLRLTVISEYIRLLYSGQNPQTIAGFLLSKYLVLSNLKIDCWASRWYCQK